MSSGRLIVGLAWVSGFACIPLPVPREVRVQPELALRVVAGPSGAPIAKASVTVVRYHYPYGVVDHSSELRTDSQGRAALAELTRRAQARGQLDPALDPQAFGRVLLSLYYGLELQKALDPTIDVATYAAAVQALLAAASRS